MKPFRFLHTADLHLGTPFHGLPDDLPDMWVKKVTTAAEEVVKRIVDIAIFEQVDFLTIAGDLFDSTDTGMFVQFELMRGFERLAEKHIPVFMTHGNHDPLVAGRFLNWPSNVYVFDAVMPALPKGYEVPSTVLKLDDTTRIQISGFSYGSKELYTSLADAFVRLPDVHFAIGLYHGTIGKDGEHENYCPAKVEDLVRTGYDFWGLGHIHKPSVIREQNPVILYPGNPQGRHIRESGIRGCTLVDVSQSGMINTRFVPVCSIVWNELEVCVDGCDSIEAVRDALLNGIANYIQDMNFECVIRIVLTGQTDAHSQLDDVSLRRLIEEEAEARHWPVCIERVNLQTMPPLDETVLIHSDSYAGTVLRTINDFQSNLEKAKALLLPNLSDVFHAANGLSFHDLSDDEVQLLLSSAKRELAKYLVSRSEVK